MKITQKQAIEAYKTVRKLEHQDMPGDKAMVMFRMRKALEPQYQFQDEQERKALETLEANIRQDGGIEFKDIESKNLYIQKLDEIGALEVEIQWEKEELEIHGLTLNAIDIAALEPIVEIV